MRLHLRLPLHLHRHRHQHQHLRLHLRLHLHLRPICIQSSTNERSDQTTLRSHQTYLVLTHRPHQTAYTYLGTLATRLLGALSLRLSQPGQLILLLCLLLSLLLFHLEFEAQHHSIFGGSSLFPDFLLPLSLSVSASLHLGDLIPPIFCWPSRVFTSQNHSECPPKTPKTPTARHPPTVNELRPYPSRLTLRYAHTYLHSSAFVANLRWWTALQQSGLDSTLSPQLTAHLPRTPVGPGSFLGHNLISSPASPAHLGPLDLGPVLLGLGTCTHLRAPSHRRHHQHPQQHHLCHLHHLSTTYYSPRI